MLKKPPFSPAQPRHAETCLNPGFVLASLRDSTYGTRGESLSTGSGRAGEKVTLRLFARCGLVCGETRLDASGLGG